MRATPEEGVYRTAVAYVYEEFGRACLDAARPIVLAAVYDRAFDPAAEAERLRDLAREVCPFLFVADYFAAAPAHGIPVQRLGKIKMGTVLQFGHGVRQRRIMAAVTDRTGAIADSISQDKELTRSMLRAVGVPVSEGGLVDDAEDAWSTACDLGLPVVVKPRDCDYGQGVAVNLTTREQVVAAYEAARARSDDVLVERYVPGLEYRLLVVGGRVVAAIRRDPPQVVGDGRSTVAQLVEQLNRDSRRGDGRSTPLYRVELDDTALSVLAEQGLSPDAVAEAGVRILIRRNTKRWSGGTTTDVTDEVHPEVAARAIDAARVVGLDVAGLDIIAADVARPLEEQGGVVLEVNSEPALQLHLRPAWGKPRPVVEEILAMLYPRGDTGRIPIVAVTGTNGKTTTTRLIAHILRATGRTIGMTCSDGIYVDRRRIEAGDCSGPNSARTILLNPTVEAAVLETARGGILTGGLGFDRCDVAVVTNMGEGDHVGSHGIHTVDELASVKSTVLTVVAPGGTVVLNAADPRVAAMAVVSPEPVIYFARDAENPIIVRHRSEGGKAAFVRDGSIVLAEGDREEPLVPLVRVPMTHEGRAGFQVENALAGSAAAWALGVPPETIRAALESFAGDPELTPGRFNVLKARGATLIIDYAHNASALAALVKALDQFPHRERLIVYSAAVYDRRDADILRQGEILGNGFDRVILYEDQCIYGRPDGETIALLRQGLAAGSRVSEVHETRGEFTAIETALNQLRPDDLAVIGPESVEEALAFVERRLDVHPPVER